MKLFEKNSRQGAKNAKVIIAIFIAAILITGCSMEPEDNIGTLHGVWYFNSGGYEGIVIIDIVNRTIIYEDTYIADIINYPDFKAKNGVLILKFTSYKKWELSEENWQLVNDENSIGKFGALYWINLQSNTVRMSDAYIEGTHVLRNTEEEANTSFTLDKTGDYITVWGGPYYK